MKINATYNIDGYDWNITIESANEKDMIDVASSLSRGDEIALGGGWNDFDKEYVSELVLGSDELVSLSVDVKSPIILK